MAYPYEGLDGQLRFLMTDVSPNSDGVYLWPASFQVVQTSPDSIDAPSVLRPEPRTAGEALWAGDDRGVLIREIEADQPFPFHGNLVWLPADGSPPVHAADDGH